MEINGKLFLKLPIETGKSANGDWKKANFVIETQDQYAKKICFSNFNDKAEIHRFTEGSVVKVFFEPESREWQGKWFTDLKAWRVVGDNVAQNSEDTNNSLPEIPSINLNSSDAGDLPF